MTSIQSIIESIKKYSDDTISSEQEKELTKYIQETLEPGNFSPETQSIEDIGLHLLNFEVIYKVMASNKNVNLKKIQKPAEQKKITAAISYEEIQHLQQVIGPDKTIAEINAIIIRDIVNDISKEIENSNDKTLEYHNSIIETITTIAEKTMAPKILVILNYNII